MARYVEVEFSEGTYKALWLALVKRGDQDSIRLFKEVVHSDRIGAIYHYYMAKDLLFGFLEELQTAGYHPGVIDTNMILNNTHKRGYFARCHARLMKAASMKV